MTEVSTNTPTGNLTSDQGCLLLLPSASSTPGPWQCFTQVTFHSSSAYLGADCQKLQAEHIPKSPSLILGSLEMLVLPLVDWKTQLRRDIACSESNSKWVLLLHPAVPSTRVTVLPALPWVLEPTFPS